MERLQSVSIEEDVESEGVKPAGSANGVLLRHAGRNG